MGFQGDADVAAAAALIGEPARAALLVALTEGDSLPARELAARAGIAPSTASGHLARLLDGRLVVAERSGRHRYFRLAGAEVATAIEALSVIAPPRPVRSLRAAAVGEALREARTCYDHLAGRLGVEVTAALERRRVLIHDEQHGYRLGPGAPLTSAGRPSRANGAPRVRIVRATASGPRAVAGCARPPRTRKTTSGSSSATRASKSPARDAARNASTSSRCRATVASGIGA